MLEQVKVLTRGIAEEFSAYQIERIWQQFEQRRQNNPRLDYLQVFWFADQEIWVIDDGFVFTMLLPEEY